MNDPFLESLLENPTNDTTRLVYADWLEEQGDLASLHKAEFLRITVKARDNRWSQGQRKAKESRLQLLADKIDSSWLAIVSRPPIENCRQKPAPSFSFSFICDRNWDELETCDDPKIRHCDRCNKNVHFCENVIEGREHARAGNCVAIDPGVIRTAKDLDTRRIMTLLGVPAPISDPIRREHQQTHLDVDIERRDAKKK